MPQHQPLGMIHVSPDAKVFASSSMYFGLTTTLLMTFLQWRAKLCTTLGAYFPAANMP